MKLHYFPTSYWSRNITLVVAEKGLEIERVFVDIRRHATFEPDYIRLNAKGVVPTLVDGAPITNGMRIARHLDAYGRALYQLYYLLVHVNLFGQSYVAGSRAAADRVLAAFG